MFHDFGLYYDQAIVDPEEVVQELWVHDQGGMVYFPRKEMYLHVKWLIGILDGIKIMYNNIKERDFKDIK